MHLRELPLCPWGQSNIRVLPPCELARCLGLQVLALAATLLAPAPVSAVWLHAHSVGRLRSVWGRWRRQSVPRPGNCPVRAAAAVVAAAAAAAAIVPCHVPFPAPLRSPACPPPRVQTIIRASVFQFLSVLYCE